MDKITQAAREARLAQALRTNLRRRKAGDPPRAVAEVKEPLLDIESTAESDPSRDEPAS